MIVLPGSEGSESGKTLGHVLISISLMLAPLVFVTSIRFYDIILKLQKLTVQALVSQMRKLSPEK